MDKPGRAPIAVFFEVAVGVAVIVGACGCNRGPSPVLTELHDTLTARQDEIDALRVANETLAHELTETRQIAENLQEIGDKRIENFQRIEAIKLGRSTGGIGTDGVTGDDAIKVILKPIDQHGRVFSAVGSLRVRLLDLAAADKMLLAEFTWTPAELAGNWAAGLGTYHYSLTCPLPTGKVTSDQITVRVDMIDYVTGQEHSAQTTCQITVK